MTWIRPNHQFCFVSVDNGTILSHCHGWIACISWQLLGLSGWPLPELSSTYLITPSGSGVLHRKLSETRSAVPLWEYSCKFSFLLPQEVKTLRERVQKPFHFFSNPLLLWLISTVLFWAGCFSCWYLLQGSPTDQKQLLCVCLLYKLLVIPLVQCSREMY